MSPDGGQGERHVVIVPADVETVSRAIRDLVSRARDSPERVRTWAIIGDMGTRDGLTENERVVEHDRVGRLAVRLAVDRTLCVGDSRAVRAPVSYTHLTLPTIYSV